MDNKSFMNTLPECDLYYDRISRHLEQQRKIKSESDAQEGERLVPKYTAVVLCNFNTTAKETYLLQDGTKTTQSLSIEFENKIFQVNFPLSGILSMEKILDNLRTVIGFEKFNKITSPKLYLAEKKLQDSNYFILQRLWLTLNLRLRGGGYTHKQLKGLDQKEQLDIAMLHGKKKIYHVIPDIWCAELLEELPRRSIYHFVLQTPYPTRSVQAIKKYTGQDEYLLFNMRLNLLNKVVDNDKDFFSNLMEVCLGSFQTDLPDVVYRYCNLTKKEYLFYQQNIHKIILYRQFLSTSTCNNATKELGSSRFVILLKKGRRHGAFYVGASSQFPNEKEVLLCAYSLYTIISVTSSEIILEYADYYEYSK